MTAELKNTTVQIADTETVEMDEADTSRNAFLSPLPGGKSGGSKFTVFVVNITMHTGSASSQQHGMRRGATTWQVRRRYREFYVLRRRLGKSVEKIKFLFPGKTYLGKACSDEELHQRSTRLAGWLQGTLKLAREQVRACCCVPPCSLRCAAAEARLCSRLLPLCVRSSSCAGLQR